MFPTCAAIQHRQAALRRLPRRMRRGAVIPLFAFLFVIIIAAAAFTVDVAYMHLVRTELQHATDAAARAASNSLGSSQDLDLAKTAAKDIAAVNGVAGSPLVLTDDDIEFGQSLANEGGTYTFVPSENPINAVRIRGSRARVSASGAVRLLLGPLLGRQHFEPEVFASSARVDRDIVIVVDRSGSMAWDESGIDWSYPAEYKKNSQNTNYGLPPHPTGSRWAGLIEAAMVFRDAVNDTREEEHLGLVSYSDQYTFNGQTVTTVSTNSKLTSDSSVIVQKLQQLGEKPIIGGTNISAGLDRAVEVIQDPATARPFAFKMIVLMTDGVWNAGRDPVLAAEDAAAAGIVVHAITFSAGANQADMQAVAEATGGRFYHAPTREELKDAFEEIAYSIPVILIE